MPNWYPEVMSAPPSRAFQVYLAVLAVIGGAVIYLATSRMGPGISTDSAMILSTAENLMQGRGLVDYGGQELTQFPPLYPLIIGVGSLATGQDVLVIGWFLNILTFGALIWLSGRYLWAGFSDEPILAYFASFVVLTSASLIKISANIASDPFFMVLLILFLMSASAYLERGQTRHVILAAVLTVVACFQRYAGLSLVIAGSLIVAYRHRHHVRDAVALGALFGLITGAPIVAWGLLHNAPVNGTVLGARLPAVPALNFVTGAEKVLYWFIPHRIISAVGTLTVLGLVIGTCAILMIATGAARFWEDARRPLLVPSLVFLWVYGAILVFGISYYELKGIETDRVHIMILTPLLMVLSAVGSQLFRAARRRFTRGSVYFAAIALFAIWASYPISKSAEYVSNSMSRGEASSYNSINKGNIRDSALAHYVKGLDLSGNTVYTNGSDTAWFILRTQVRRLPWLPSINREAELEERFSGWPGADGQGYILWINGEASKTFYAAPAELGAIADVHRLYSDGVGEVYSVKSRQ
jgi:hypothetical protein